MAQELECPKRTVGWGCLDESDEVCVNPSCADGMTRYYIINADELDVFEKGTN